MSDMNKKGKVDWSKIDGSSPKPKRLHLEKEETDSLYHCRIQACGHDGFKSQCGCRKHLNIKHSWFFFFDQNPTFQVSSQIGELFTKWLTGSGGGCEKDRAAQQIAKRCFQFLKFCCEDEKELSFEVLVLGNSFNRKCEAISPKRKCVTRDIG